MDLTLRAHLALAARAARRLFPLLVPYADVADNCDKGIAAAEAFAAGEPGSLLRARELAERLTRDFSEHPLLGDLRVHAAYGTAAHVAGGAEHAFSAVTRTPPSMPCSKNAHQFANNAIEVPSAGWARTDYEHLIDAIKNDRERLERGGFQSDQVNELGPPVDTSSVGMLGPLWVPREGPNWYAGAVRSARERSRARSQVDIISFEDFRSRTGAAPHFVCWELGNHDSLALGSIEGEILQVRQISVRRDQPIPGLVVYAPGIPERDRVRLALLGAIVDTGLLTPYMTPRRSVSEALRVWLDDANENWERTATGSWIYVGADVTWRMPERKREARGPLPEQRDKAPVSRRPALAPRKAYAELLAKLRQSAWWGGS